MARVLMPERVLVIDDDPLLASLIASQCQSIGVPHTLTASSGQEALDLITSKKFAPDVAIVDLMMPDMDGVELLNALGDIGAKFRVVIASGAEERVIEMSRKLADQFGLEIIGAISKPVTSAQLLNLLTLGRTMKISRPANAADRQPGALDEEALVRAILEKRVVPYFQPQIDALSGETVGFEMLARIDIDGMIHSPFHFIALAEERLAIGALTKVLLENATPFIRATASLGNRALRFSVNFSPTMLSEEHWPTTLRDICAACNIANQRLTIEVTESRLLDNAPTVLKVLTRLRMQGFELAIDDFGTGYATYSLLNSLPFGELKIDRQFVHRACREPSLAAILGSSVDIAQRLNLRSVAEGVEDVEDLDFARKLGCDIIQGYHYSRPLPASDALQWITQAVANTGQLRFAD